MVFDVADALETVVRAAAGQVDQMGDQVAADSLGLTKWVMPNFSASAFFRR